MFGNSKKISELEHRIEDLAKENRSLRECLAAVERERDESVQRGAGTEQRNQEFHEALISACTSQWTLRFRALLYQQSRRYRWLSAVQTEVSSTVHEQHQAIFEASLGRDVERADQLLTEHLGLTLLGIVDKRLLK